MLRLQYYLSRSEQQPFRLTLLVVLFFIFGFSLAFSSADIFPFVFIHESGHFVTAKVAGVRMEKIDSSSYYMFLVKDKPIRDYVRVLRGGYKSEILLWYAFIAVFFCINVIRTRRFKDGIHFPVAALPGYVVGLFSKLKGTTDIRAIADLRGLPEAVVLNRIILEETALLILVLGMYIGGFFLFLRLSAKGKRLFRGVEH